MKEKFVHPVSRYFSNNVAIALREVATLDFEFAKRVLVLRVYDDEAAVFG
jgi:hypothetical protein